VHADKPEAYAVDRAAFDQSLADQAKAAGATYKLGAGCSGITRANGGVAATIRGQNGDGRVRARVVIVATGVNYSLSRDLGAPRPTKFLRAAQTEVRMKGVKEVEVYLGGRISPGSFGWAIPLGGDRVKLGVCNEGRAFPYMQRLLESPRVRSRLRNQRPEVKTKPIPISPAKRTYADRVLLAGDAAGQVKPTTGGGIHYGIVCGELAARTLDDAFSCGDLSERRLARYQARWRKELGWEIVVGSYFRRFGKWLTDSQIDELVRSYTNPALRDLVQSSAAFERHSRFVLALSRSPIFWRALWAPIRAHLVRR
ncbi:MAG: FAD-dependent oxidoreductase, partial [Gemmatimonadales bacterium]|nr:FAD-dependent oxidoreductase [Gemmatimonadales bacterium]